MKPRLKLTRGGGLHVIKTGSNPWREASAKQFVQEHYGSLSAFATRFQLPYSAVRMALKTGHQSLHMEGNVAVVRQVLGLPSKPSKAGLVTSLTKKRTGA